jgi:hypothetical protein
MASSFASVILEGLPVLNLLVRRSVSFSSHLEAVPGETLTFAAASRVDHPAHSTRARNRAILGVGCSIRSVFRIRVTEIANTRRESRQAGRHWDESGWWLIT